VGEGGTRDCRLELAEVDTLDSTGAAALTVWQRRLRRAGHRLVLFRPNGRVRQALRQAGLDHLETSDILEPSEAA
jgi:anti-anti-sigma regulatory factor